MPLLDTGAIPIRAKRTSGGTGVLADFIPYVLPIVRVEQDSAAWCYAACAEMVINYSHQEQKVKQCEVASFVKSGLGEELDCCNGSEPECVRSGCQRDDIGFIFDKWDVAFEDDAPPDNEILGIVSLSKLKDEFDARRPVEVVVSWNDDAGAHALLITGVNGSMLFIIDPLTGGGYYGGLREYEDLKNGFGSGLWSETWPGLKKK